MAKIAELELAEKEKMKDKVEKILKHNANVFINRLVHIGREERQRRNLRMRKGKRYLLKEKENGFVGTPIYIHLLYEHFLILQN